jgi:hypothetical protein
VALVFVRVIQLPLIKLEGHIIFDQFTIEKAPSRRWSRMLGPSKKNSSSPSLGVARRSSLSRLNVLRWDHLSLEPLFLGV